MFQDSLLFITVLQTIFMIGEAVSINGAKIRLTEERWVHIVESHDDMTGLSFEILDAIQSPEMIIKGLSGELLAVKRKNYKYIVSVYKEVGKDGFVITAFLIKNIERLKKRGVIWKK